jgi:hypothetical protein
MPLSFNMRRRCAENVKERLRLGDIFVMQFPQTRHTDVTRKEKTAFTGGGRPRRPTLNTRSIPT